MMLHFDLMHLIQALQQLVSRSSRKMKTEGEHLGVDAHQIGVSNPNPFCFRLDFFEENL